MSKVMKMPVTDIHRPDKECLPFTIRNGDQTVLLFCTFVHLYYSLNINRVKVIVSEFGRIHDDTLLTSLELYILRNPLAYLGPKYEI
jgi:hypothetical protein